MGLTVVAESPGPARCSCEVWGAGVALGLDASSYEQKELECGALGARELGAGCQPRGCVQPLGVGPQSGRDSPSGAPQKSGPGGPCHLCR